MNDSTEPAPGKERVGAATREDTSKAAASGDDSATTVRREGLLGGFSARQLALLGGAVLSVAAVLFVATMPLARDSTPDVQTGGGFYQLSARTQGLEVGQLAPDFVGTNGEQEVRLTGLDGREVRIADFRGRPLWVFFWATWCPPCQQETPDVRDAFEAHRDEGLLVLAIDIQEPVEVVSDYVELYDLRYTIGIDTDGTIMATYGVFGLPTHYFIDRDGLIRDRYFGPLSREAMEERIRLISEP